MSASFNYSKEAKRPLLEEVTLQQRTVQRACSQRVKEAGVQWAMLRERHLGVEWPFHDPGWG